MKVSVTSLTYLVGENIVMQEVNLHSARVVIKTPIMRGLSPAVRQ